MTHIFVTVIAHVATDVRGAERQVPVGGLRSLAPKASMVACPVSSEPIDGRTPRTAVSFVGEKGYWLCEEPISYFEGHLIAQDTHVSSSDPGLFELQDIDLQSLDSADEGTSEPEGSVLYLEDFLDESGPSGKERPE